LGRRAAVVDAARIGSGAKRFDETRMAFAVVGDCAVKLIALAPKYGSQALSRYRVPDPVAISVELADEETA
jgi:hypothetical protein